MARTVSQTAWSPVMYILNTTTDFNVILMLSTIIDVFDDKTVMH